MSKVTSTKNQIVEGALAALLSDGLPNLSYDRVAQAAGTSRQLVRYHFRDPDALMVTVCDRLAAAYGEALAEGGLPVREGRSGLHALFDFLLDALDGRPKPRDEAVFDALAVHAPTSPRIRAALRGHYALLGRAIAEEAQAAHPALGDEAAAEIAYLAVALVYGHWRMVAALGFAEAHRAITRTALDRIVASYLEGEDGHAADVVPWTEEGEAAA